MKRWVKWLSGTFLMFFFTAVMAILLWEGFWIGYKSTKKTEFCITCHPMKYVYEEYKQSPHYKSRTGVTASCPDCHVTGFWEGQFAATRHIWAYFFNPVTDEKNWEERRPRLAKGVREWMLKNDSAPCRKCHKADHMEPINKGMERAHKKMEGGKKTCIDCHYNLVHAEVPWPEKEGG